MTAARSRPATPPDAPASPPAGASPSLRVLYVDYSVGFGGATKSLSLVCGALPHVEKVIVTCQDPHLIRTWYSGMRVVPFRRLANYRTYARLSAQFQRLLGTGVVFKAGRKLLAALDLLASLWNTLRLARLIRRHRVDCVHLNNGYMPLEGLLAARLARVPCIVHARGMAGPKHGLALRASHWATHTIAVSNAVAETVRRVMPGHSVTTVYDPVSIARFDATEGERSDVRQRLGFAPRDIIVGMFGRIVRWKGQLEFVRAVALAMRQNPNLRALIVGDESDGGAEYFADVRRAIAESGCRERFVLTGYQPAVSGLYHACDIVVHASIEPEPFGMVVPEAMAARRPIIASAAGGPCEVVSDGVDGMLVAPGDVAALARAIVALASDPARRQAMGEHGRAKVIQAFGIEHIAQQVAAVYCAVVWAR